MEWKGQVRVSANSHCETLFQRGAIRLGLPAMWASLGAAVGDSARVAGTLNREQSPFCLFSAISNVRRFRVGHFLSVVFQAVRRHLFVFIVIVLVLASGKLIRSQWHSVQQIVDELPALRASEAELARHQADLAASVTRRAQRLSGATAQQLDGQIQDLDNEIGRLERAPDGVSLSSGVGGVVQQLQAQAARGVELELLRQARAHLVAVRMHAVVLGNRQAAVNTLEQLRLTHVRTYTALRSADQQLRKLEAEAGVLARVPFTRWQAQATALRRSVNDLYAANTRAHAEYAAQQAVLARLALPDALTSFRVNEHKLAAAAAPLRERIGQAERLAAQNHLWQAYQAVRPVLPLALAVLVGWWLVPALIRTLFYFVLAPLAARRPAMKISATQGFTPAGEGSRISAVSRTVTLAPGHDMLIRPDYCQSQPAGVVVTTKLLFNWHSWLTSLAARLWMLKRLRATHPADIVVSAIVDALDEVAFLEMAPGEALVLQPRALVGMIYPGGQRPVIRSHWRLGTLHAWLTLQLRYLAFEGPATLIVKGCRGVRLENAAGGRTISQEATLGFSANALYGTVRADPFIPYLRGRQPLFHDNFTGAHACYLYEEVPRNARLHGQPRNPLEVLLDTGLKAFGI